MDSTRKNIQNIVQKNNFSSFMSDSKWRKLFENLVEEFDTVFIRYKLLGSEKIMETEYDVVDYNPFFIEPILYQEIEWVEFPKEVLIIKNKRISRQEIFKYEQDIIKIENFIAHIGKFATEKYNGTLRLYGYK